MEGPSKQNLAPSARKSILGDLNARRNSVGKNAGKKKIQKSINELPQFSEKVKKLAKRMLFRVKMYLMLNRAKKKVMSYQDMMNPGYSRLIRVLQNPFRSTASAEFILDYIKQLSFFGNFIRDLGDVDDSAIVELCKCLKYEYIPVATCIFKEHDISNDKFYVILKGSVSFVKKKDANVIILEKEKEKEEAPPQQELKSPAEIKSPFLTTGAAELISPSVKRPSILPLGKHANEDSANPGDDSSSQPDSMAHENIEQTTLFNLIMSLGIKVGEMHEGEGFGEKALLAKNSKRTASVVTNSNCDFIILSKKDYIDIITKFDKRSQAKMKFMKSCIPHLNSITSSEIWSNLFYLVREVDYSKGIILGAEGASGKNIYFIHDGYCDLEKTIIVNRSKQHQKLEPLKIKRKLATFGCGSCLGEEILIGEDPKYEYNIVVSSIMAKIYIIDRQSFLKRFPWETVLAVIDAFKSKQFVHKQKIQKFTENLDTSKFEQSKQSMTVQTDHLSQLMRPAMRASMANHLKLLFTQEKNQERVQSVDSSHVRTFETPTKPSPLQKAESTRLFMRGSIQPFHKETSFNSYQSKESKGTADLNGSMNSQQTEQKVYESDEINIEEPNSALSYRSGGRHFSENFRISPTFYNRRVETAKPDVKRPSKRLLTVATESSQERKSQFYVEETPSPQFEKFDFGTPTSTTTKSQFRRTFLKQETQEQQGLEASTPTLKEPRTRLLTAIRDSPALDTLVSEKEKRMFGKLRLGSRARSRLTETPTSNQTPTIKLDDLITIKTTVTEGTPKALSPGLAHRYWSIDDSEQQRPKSHFSKHKVRVIEIGKTEAEVSKESLKLLMRNAEEGKKNTSKGTIKDKRRILDSLNTRKQKEKFNIKTMTKSMTPIASVHTHKIHSNNPSKYPTHQDLANT